MFISQCFLGSSIWLPHSIISEGDIPRILGFGELSVPDIPTFHHISDIPVVFCAFLSVYIVYIIKLYIDDTASLHSTF